jgi:hypothetical protein
LRLTKVDFTLDISLMRLSIDWAEQAGGLEWQMFVARMNYFQLCIRFLHPRFSLSAAAAAGGDFNLAPATTPPLVWRVIKIRLVTAFIITRLTAL